MRSFRARLALAHLAAIVAVLTVAAIAGYLSLAGSVHAQLDAALLALAETEVGMLVQSDGSEVVVHEAPTGHAPPSFVRLDRLVQITNASGDVVARSANLGTSRLPVSPALLKHMAAGETVFGTLTQFGDEPTRMVSVPVRARGSLWVVQVAGSLDDTERVVASASLLFAVMGVALIVVVGAVGAMLTRHVFSTIDGVVRQARNIDEANLARRLPRPGTRDEIGRLVDTLNEMLDRIERSFEAQRRFTADASHEMRSPLSRLRTELEVTLRRPRDPAEYVAALSSCLAEVKRLSGLVEELLILARLDAGVERSPAEGVSLNRLAGEAALRFGQQAKERHVRIDLHAPTQVSVRVAPVAASLMLANLLDNAVKFSPPGGCVTVSLALEGSDATVTVCDAGPGIRDDELPRLFERFYRGSRARAEDAPGVGLGLAVSQAIAAAHGGGIDASNLPEGGALFRLRLPAA